MRGKRIAEQVRAALVMVAKTAAVAAVVDATACREHVESCAIEYQCPGDPMCNVGGSGGTVSFSPDAGPVIFRTGTGGRDGGDSGSDAHAAQTDASKTGG